MLNKRAKTIQYEANEAQKPQYVGVHEDFEHRATKQCAFAAAYTSMRLSSLSRR
jgi:hypothetical protein